MIVSLICSVVYSSLSTVTVTLRRFEDSNKTNLRQGHTVDIIESVLILK